VYFADPKDVIPDHVQVLGYLDDAIMIELCVRELRHELEAYDDFCEYREREATRRGIEPSAVGRTDWLDSRRDELVERMHARREWSAPTSGWTSSTPCRGAPRSRRWASSSAISAPTGCAPRCRSMHAPTSPMACCTAAPRCCWPKPWAAVPAGCARRRAAAW